MVKCAHWWLQALLPTGAHSHRAIAAQLSCLSVRLALVISPLPAAACKHSRRVCVGLGVLVQDLIIYIGYILVQDLMQSFPLWCAGHVPRTRSRRTNQRRGCMLSNFHLHRRQTVSKRRPHPSFCVRLSSLSVQALSVTLLATQLQEDGKLTRRREDLASPRVCPCFACIPMVHALAAIRALKEEEKFCLWQNRKTIGACEPHARPCPALAAWLRLV